MLILAGTLLASGCQAGAVQPVVFPTAADTATIGLPTATETVELPTATLAPSATPTKIPEPEAFNGERAMQAAAVQLAFGPRTVGSAAHLKTGDWIAHTLRDAGWEVEIQETVYQGQPVRNIIGKRGAGAPWVILGAHYDSRLAADRDPDPQKLAEPVPGANDGASGVAVLLELARVLPGQLENRIDSGLPRANQVWMVFFDSEDNGRLPGWDWILGSRAFVQSLAERPDAAVIVDMIGDADLNVYQEHNSDPRLNQEIWAQAAALGYGELFIPENKHSILDDHTPFLEIGIPAADLIDFDYPYYHTTADTIDKLSPASLKAIGDTLIAWLRTGSTVFSQP